MKYLDALLKEHQFSPDIQKSEPQKPVCAVFAGGSSTHAEIFQPPSPGITSTERKALAPNTPYLTARGELIISFESDQKYHWWAGGQSIAETLQELNAPPEVRRRYVQGFTDTRQ